jgi:hypothetical protein
VADGAAGQGEVRVGEDGDDADAVDAVDVRDDLGVLVVVDWGWEGCRTRCMVRSQFSSMKVW